MMGYMTNEVGIDGMLIAPGYQYSQIDPALTMTRAEHEEKFRRIRAAAQEHGYRWLASPIYQDFLTGERELPCAPWGSITRNPYGWKGPCYLLTDGIFPTYEALHGGDRVGDVRARQRPAVRALRDPLRLRARSGVRRDVERQGDRPEHGLDADGMTLACATRPEERVARRLGARTARRRDRRPAQRRARRAGSSRSGSPAGSTTGSSAARCSTRHASSTRTASSSGRARPLGVAGARDGDDPRRRRDRRRPGGAPRAARADRRRRGRHGVRRARPHAAGSPAACGSICDTPSRPLGPLAEMMDANGKLRPGGIVRALAAPRRTGRALADVRRALTALRQCRAAGRGGRVTAENGHKRVLLAAPRSFCAGVDRAIEIVERLLEQHGPPVYVRHQIVHNEHVVRRLEAIGAVFVESRGRDPGRRDLRALGARRRAGRAARTASSEGLRVVDAVCPLVSKVHAEARRYADSGPSRRADRPRQPRRGDRDEGRAAGADRRRRVARGRARSWTRTASRSR